MAQPDAPAALIETVTDALRTATKEEPAEFDYEGDHYLILQDTSRTGIPRWDEDRQEEVTEWVDNYSLYCGLSTRRPNHLTTRGKPLEELAASLAGKVQYHSERGQRRLEGQRQFERGLIRNHKRGFL